MLYSTRGVIWFSCKCFTRLSRRLMVRQRFFFRGFCVAMRNHHRWLYGSDRELRTEEDLERSGRKRQKQQTSIRQKKKKKKKKDKKTGSVLAFFLLSRWHLAAQTERYPSKLASQLYKTSFISINIDRGGRGRKALKIQRDDALYPLLGQRNCRQENRRSSVHMCQANKDK